MEQQRGNSGSDTGTYPNTEKIGGKPSGTGPCQGSAIEQYRSTPATPEAAPTFDRSKGYVGTGERK